MSDSRRTVRVPPSTLSRELQGETVLLQLERGEYFGLDEIGTRIWQLMVECGDLDVVGARLAEEFEADPEALRRDVEDLAQDMAARHLIELSR
jgi:hypothetical protein